jgi:hypothetical protein
LHLELLRRARRWEQLMEADPTDEPACRELMRRALARGSRPAAIRWFVRLRTALRRELGMAPSAETLELFKRCVAGFERPDAEPVERDLELVGVDIAVRDAMPRPLVLHDAAGTGRSARCYVTIDAPHVSATMRTVRHWWGFTYDLTAEPATTTTRSAPIWPSARATAA